MAYGEAIVVLTKNYQLPQSIFKSNLHNSHQNALYISPVLSDARNDLWLKHASHANMMAAQLADGLKHIGGVEITQSTEVNAVFLKLPARSRKLLQDWSYFYDWEQENEIRLMTSFETTAEDVERMLEGIRWAMERRATDGS